MPTARSLRCDSCAPRSVQWRPVAWCVLDWASEATAALTDLLLHDWGAGLCYQPGVPWTDPSRPAVLPHPAVSRILHSATIRVWWSESRVPDRQHVMESLEHGCLPQQFTPALELGSDDGLSEVCRSLVLRPDGEGSIPRLPDDELRHRLETVATALRTNELERELPRRSG
jgi:hypothetical protein